MLNTIIMRLLVILLLVIVNIAQGHAQQDPAYTKYKFNPLVFNPGYAGSHEHLSLNLAYRRQWLGFEGAPRSMFFSAHSPLRRENVALGMSLSSDQIGATGRFNGNVSYAYRSTLRNGFKLSMGLQAGIQNWHSDWSSVIVQQGSDQVFRVKDSRTRPNFGAGVYLSNERFYVGLSCPSLLEYNLRASDKPETEIVGRSYRHYYFMMCGLFLLNEKSLIFRPSMLLKNTSALSRLRGNSAYRDIGSPTELDLDATLIFNQVFWVGLGMRQPLEISESRGGVADLWASWQLSQGMRFGAAYDFVLGPARLASSNSFEVMLGWEFDAKIKKAASIRYF
jgi:type IX secretion system PorP/SprF family membrane protein